MNATSWESGFVEANGIRMAYTRTGGEKPPLVLAHGVTDSGPCWTPVAAELAAEYDIVMVDARGHGHSDAPPGRYDAVTQARDHAGVIAALGLRKPAVMGHSMGAVTALALAGLFPELPAAIVLEDPPGWWGEGAMSEEMARELEERRRGALAWISGFARKSVAELIAEQRASSAIAWPEAELEPWAKGKKQVSPHVANLFDPEPLRATDWPAILRAVRCPALLITGDPALGSRHDPRAIAALQEFVPQLQHVQIMGAGHSIRREQPERFMAAVRPFLASLARPDEG